MGGIPSIVAVSSGTNIGNGRVVTGGYGWVVEQPEDGPRGTGGARVTGCEPLCAAFCGINLEEHLINWTGCECIDWVDTFKEIANRRRSLRHSS